jgi:L-rhamnose mutarotase
MIMWNLNKSPKILVKISHKNIVVAELQNVSSYGKIEICKVNNISTYNSKDPKKLFKYWDSCHSTKRVPYIIEEKRHQEQYWIITISSLSMTTQVSNTNIFPQ